MKNAKGKKRSSLLYQKIINQELNDIFFYVPNICIAETFGVFAKYRFGKWNEQAKGKTISDKEYKKAKERFHRDIHNGRVFYQYELSRYHILGVDLTMPIDHYYQIERHRGKKKRIIPQGTFDHLILSMGIQLNKIHGKDNFFILTADDRLARVATKCKKSIPESSKKKLSLSDDKVNNIIGQDFSSDIFPPCFNIKTVSNKTFEKLLDIAKE